MRKPILLVFMYILYYFFRENHDIFAEKMIISDLDMFTQFEFEATIFEQKPIQIVFRNPENISNKTTALNFSNLTLIFYYDWIKMYLNIDKTWFLKINLIFQYIIGSTQKTKTKNKKHEPLFCSHDFGDSKTGFVFVLT